MIFIFRFHKVTEKNKEKCNILKTIRKNIAKKIGIDLKQKECTFKGECTGTCPTCQMKEKILNEQLLLNHKNNNKEIIENLFGYSPQEWKQPDNRTHTLGAIDYNYFMQEQEKGRKLQEEMLLAKEIEQNKLSKAKEWSELINTKNSPNQQPPNQPPQDWPPLTGLFK